MKNKFIKELKSLASPEKSLLAQRYFKCGKGEYSEGDKFLGVTVPDCRKISKKYVHLSYNDLKDLLKNPYHEVRHTTLLILVQKFKSANDILEKEKITKFYLSNRHGINNWDLVDVSSYKILGEYCFLTDTKILEKLIISKRHWDRRIGIVATLAFIKKGKTEIVYKFSKLLFDDPEDLMHKASGWMLREAGKISMSELEKFINRYGKKMPRTMLRYSIEKFPEKKRLAILEDTKIIK